MTKPVSYAMMAFLISGTICYAFLTYQSFKSERRLDKSIDAIDSVRQRITEPVSFGAEEFLKGETA